MPDSKLPVKFFDSIPLTLEALDGSPNKYVLPNPHGNIPEAALLTKLATLFKLPSFILDYLPKLVTLLSLILDRGEQPAQTTFTLEVDASALLLPFNDLLHFKKATLKIDTQEPVLSTE